MNQSLKATKTLHKKHRRYPCCRKVHYKTRQEANLMLAQYLNQVLMSNMVVYRCFLHRAWEMGHDRFMQNESIVARDERQHSISVKGDER